MSILCPWQATGPNRAFIGRQICALLIGGDERCFSPLPEEMREKMFDNGYTENSGIDQAPDNDARKYFDVEGKLLRKHFPFVYERLFEEAKRQNKDISFVDVAAPLEIRQAAIKANQWEVGAAYLRCSTHMQDSYSGQMVSCIFRGLRDNIIILPELIAGDQGKTGKRANNPGINTVKGWIVAKMIAVIIFFSISRSSRSLHKGLKLIKEDVYEQGVRAIAIAESIDTTTAEWSKMLAFNLLLAEMQATSIPIFVRMGQKSHFEAGFQIGAAPVGYRPIIIPEGGMTKRGKPKTKLEIVPEVGNLIIKHYKMVAGGIPLAEGCRLWNTEIMTLPDEVKQYAVDGRATSKTMRPEAYRRLLSRGEYRGDFAYGRKRNRWLEGEEQTVQDDVQEQEVCRQHREHLRIVPDELYFAVQERLSNETRGKHGPRLDKEQPLSSSLISLFQCAECGHSFYSYGTQYMHCPASNRDECGSWGTVDREVAVTKVISALRDQILTCSELATEIVERSCKLDAEEKDGSLAAREAALKTTINRQHQLLMDIVDSYSGLKMPPEVTQRKASIKRKIIQLEAELAMLQSRVRSNRQSITKEQVMSLLRDFDAVLVDANAGKLGPEGKQRATVLIRLLTGGKIIISFTRLKDRRRAFGVGRFTPRPIAALVEDGRVNRGVVIPFPEVQLTFRELPRYARIADEVYRLYTDGMSMTEIGKMFNCKSGNVWEAYAFWHTSRGLEVPIKRLGMKKKTK